ncbi:MAG: hypothetical protein MHMPM18_003420 [Marteilia pararefringens]
MHRTTMLLPSLLMVMLQVSSAAPYDLNSWYTGLYNYNPIYIGQGDYNSSYSLKEKRLHDICHGGFTLKILSYYDESIVKYRFDPLTRKLCKAMYTRAVVLVVFICLICLGVPCGLGVCIIAYCFCFPKTEKKVGTDQVPKPDVDQKPDVDERADVDQKANKIEF